MCLLREESKILDSSVETVRGGRDNPFTVSSRQSSLCLRRMPVMKVPVPSELRGAETMTVTIPPEFEGFIENAVASGRYRSEAELVADALRLLRDHERQWHALREDIEIGLNELEQGDKTVLDVEDIQRRGRDRLIEQSARP